MSRQFNPPPNWPQPPAGWSPPVGWQPDPAWGPPPPGWHLWLESDHATGTAPGHDQEARIQHVFISYRRSDCQAQANGLHDGLSHRLQSAKIFMDIDSIPPGVDFEEHIRREIEICDLVLVMIGDDWLESRPETELRRIDDPDDFVRLEIESALASPRVRILPVLVEGAQMPRAGELPESIRRLARINAIELSDRRWTSDLERLAALVEKMGREQEAWAQQGESGRPTASDAEASVSPEERNMRLSDVDAAAIAAAVASMPATFNTKDVSEHADVRRAHQSLGNPANYHTMIGRYLAKHHDSLGVQPPSAAVGDRGATWHKNSAISPPHPDVPSAVGAPEFRPATPAGLQRPSRQDSSKNSTPPIGWVMVALPTLSCGLASFVPALWAASRRREDQRFTRRMYAFAAAIGVLGIGGFALLVSAPTDASGTPTGPVSDLGGGIWFACLVAATVVAVIHRKPRTQLPGTAQELARRRQRDQYRKLIDSDPALARNIHVGRPDLSRDYEDGGLLDLNSLDAPELCRFTPMPADEAERVVATRKQLGRLSSIEETAVYASLSEVTVSRLKEKAVFL